MAASLPLWRRSPIPFSILLCVVFGFAVFFELGRMDIVSDNEGQRAAPPAEMLRSGHYAVPTINGAVYLAKPPLLYWAIAPVYRLTGGPSEWAARAPGGLCAVVLVLCVYWSLRAAAGERHARWAALMTGIAPYVLERARWAQLDVPLTLAMVLAIIALQVGKGRVRPIVLGGLACGAAMMLKGPVVFPFLWASWAASVMTAERNRPNAFGTCVRWSIAALGLDFVLRGLAGLLDLGGVLTFPWGLLLLLGVWTWHAGRADWRGDRRFIRWLLAAAVGMLCVTPWAVAVLRDVGWTYVQTLLDEQVFERTHTASQINSGSSFYFFLGAPFMLAPWGLLLPALLSSALWDRFGPWYRFAVAYGGIGVATFSLFAGKEYEYILPVVPFLASALAYVWLHSGDYGDWKWLNTWVRSCKTALPILIPVLGIAAAIYFSVANPHQTLLIEIWGGVVVAAIIWRSLHRVESPARLATAALAVVLITLVARSYYYTGDRSPQAIVRYAAHLQAEGYTVESSKTYPAFAFYSALPIREVKDVDELEKKLSGDAPYFFLTRAEILATYLQALPDEDRRVIAGPVTSKNHILITNTAGSIAADQ